MSDECRVASDVWRVARDERQEARALAQSLQGKWVSDEDIKAKIAQKKAAAASASSTFPAAAARTSDVRASTATPSTVPRVALAAAGCARATISTRIGGVRVAPRTMSTR